MKKYLLILLCAFAWISVNAQNPNNGVWTIYGTGVEGHDADNIANLNSIPSGVTTIRFEGNFSGWSGGILVNDVEGVSKSGITTIDLKDANFSATTVNITPIITQVYNPEDQTTSNKITDYSYSVTNSWAFKNFDGLTNIIWPEDNSISVLPDNAFYGCTGLTSVTIPNTVEVIGDHAFETCSSLATLNYQITSSVKIFGENAFKQTALTSVTIPGSALLIRTNAFCEINALTTVTFAKDCTENLIVKTQAFDNSSNITDIYILTTAHIQCSNMAFEDDVTYGHGDTDRVLANLHFPDTQAEYFTNMTHYLDQETAADPGKLQAWLVEHARQANTLAQQGQNGWWEFVKAGGGDPNNDPSYDKGKFLMTYSHATLAHLVPDGVKAYIVNDIKYNETAKLFEVYLKSVGVIPARTGVILYGQTNATNSSGKPALAMSIVRLATKAPGATGENATLYPDGEEIPGTDIIVDLSLRRDNWDSPFDFVKGYKNYLEPTAKVDGTTTPLAPYDTDDAGQVAYRYFGFGHFYKTTIKNTDYKDYAGFFRCKKNSKIASGKAYLKLAKDEFGFTGNEVELLIKKDDNYYLRAQPAPSTGFIDERTEGYWQKFLDVAETMHGAEWEWPEDFGVRNSAIAAAKFYDLFGENEPFFQEDEATGVAKIIIPASSVETYYNLNGQRVINPTHGIFIKNGKKVIIK